VSRPRRVRAQENGHLQTHQRRRWWRCGGWLSDASSSASRRNRERRSASLEKTSGNTLIAISRLSVKSRARYTSPMPPAPRSPTISYLPTVWPGRNVTSFQTALRATDNFALMAGVSSLGLPVELCADVLIVHFLATRYDGHPSLLVVFARGICGHRLVIPRFKGSRNGKLLRPSTEHSRLDDRWRQFLFHHRVEG
jgi:hypothetical protein